MKILLSFIVFFLGVCDNSAFVSIAHHVRSFQYRRHGLDSIVVVLAAESIRREGKDIVDGDNSNLSGSSENNDQNNEWRSPSLLWNRRETGLAAALSLLAAGPMLLQRENLGMSTIMSSSTAIGVAAASPALEAGDALIRNIWLGRLAYPTLIVALEMGLFEALKDRPLSLDQLGRKLQPRLSGTSSRALEAITSVLLALGLVQWSDHHSRGTSAAETGIDNVSGTATATSARLSLTEPARAVLLQDSPYFWGAQLLAADGVTATLRRRIQLESRRAASSGSSASAMGPGVVAYDSHSDQVIDSFIDSMQSHSAVTAEATAKALESVFPRLSDNDGSSSCHILDMAGGSGCFALALAKRFPNVKVTLADLPTVVTSWKRRHQGTAASVLQRIDTVSADLFEPSTWPRDCQIVLLANVLHDWGEAQVLDILSNARLALTTSSSPSAAQRRGGDGMVVIVEQLMNQQRTGPLPAALASISMLLGDWRTGKQYTLDELTALAKEAGFDHVELGPACGSFHHAVICHTTS